MGLATADAANSAQSIQEFALIPTYKMMVTGTFDTIDEDLTGLDIQKGDPFVVCITFRRHPTDVNSDPDVGSFDNAILGYQAFAGGIYVDGNTGHTLVWNANPGSGFEIVNATMGAEDFDEITGKTGGHTLDTVNTGFFDDMFDNLSDDTLSGAMEEGVLEMFLDRELVLTWNGSDQVVGNIESIDIVPCFWRLCEKEGDAGIHQPYTTDPHSLQLQFSETTTAIAAVPSAPADIPEPQMPHMGGAGMGMVLAVGASVVGLQNLFSGSTRSGSSRDVSAPHASSLPSPDGPLG